MGVPGLLGNLGPYGHAETWHRRGTHRARALIDGPALAYYIYYRCLAQRKNASNALDAVPDYKTLCDSTLILLLLLKEHGLEIHRIFFDGALPVSKTEIRMSRLQRSVDEMRGFRSLNPILQQSSTVSSTEMSSNIFTDPTVLVSPRFKSIPAAALIVPAIRDCLLHSEHSQAVKVVPFEADLACTDPALCQPSDIIVTSDSDLFLQMPAARISFFKDLNFSTNSLTLRLYNCQEIADRLDLPKDRVALMGYHLQQDSHMALTECSRRAKDGRGLTELGFEEFRQQYHPWANEGSWSDIFSSGCYEEFRASATKLSETVQFMDPRILEAIVGAGQHGHFRLFLPPLFEDPARSTAWLIGARIRLAAFEIWVREISESKTHEYTLEEYTRHGLKVASRSSTINDTSLSRLDQELDPLCHQISLLSKKFCSLPVTHIWICISLITFLSEANSNNMLPDRKHVARLLAQPRKHASNHPSVTSWLQVQLNAQLEAWYYSLRILWQLSDLASVASLKKRKLQDLLGGMPLLHHILRNPTLGMDFSFAANLLDEDLSFFYPDFDAQKDAQDAPNESKAARKKRKAAKAAQEEPAKSAKSTGNMFDVLAEDV